MRRFMALVGMALIATPALGQSTDFQQLISGKDFAYTIPLKSLNADWKAMSITSSDSQKGGLGDMLNSIMQAAMMSEMGKGGKGKDDAAGAAMGMAMLGGLFGGGSNSGPVYYTKGQTVSIGSETFIVTYRYNKPEVNFMQLAMESEKNGGKEPDFTKLMADNKMTPDTQLSLSLINIKTLGSIDNIRPFNMDTEIAESAKGGGGLMDLLALGSRTTETVTQPAEVKTATVADDTMITSDVEAAFAADSQLSKGAWKIGVVYKNNTLILKGTVSTAAVKNHAAEVAKKALQNAGVSAAIRNDITVAAPRKR